MGNRSAKHLCESIVPDQDPLTSIPLSGRIVHADITRDFDIKPTVLGTGYSGAVRLAEHKLTKQQVAVKQFSKHGLKPHRLKLLKSEVEVYLRLDHPNICRLLHAYEGSRDVWLVMELCQCELYTRLCRSKVYCEENAADVMRQVLQAINYLHLHNIVHRDLKLENWMYGTSSTDKDRLKLIDFGFSEIMASDDTVLQMPCGTLHYTSPEVLSRSYSSKCDLWSVGVICYMLLVGRPPFRGATNSKIAHAIMNVEFPRDGRWQYLSLDAQDFIERLLKKDVAERMNASEALEHPWLKARKTTPSLDIGTDVLKSLRTFAQGSHLRRAALTILAYSLTSAELEGLEETFLDFDSSGRGTISLEQLKETMQSRLRVSSEEVGRIFHSFDSQSEEIQYTPFVAALLETRIGHHESKVRAAFEAFDVEGKGYITADSLVHGFNRLSKGTQKSLSKEEAEHWIREVDFKGNGVVNYTSFLAALMGKSLRGLPSTEDLADHPTLRIFDDSPDGGRPRGFTESFASTTASTNTVRQLLNDVAADTDSDSKEGKDGRDVRDKDGRVRSRSFTGSVECAERVQIRNMACEVDERYFA
ncbi:Calcium-dependent protein kinase 2 (PfCDPK2) [Durusdinium trenchii]|uniref:Calcium-dependent protein kinase 2 (PfCDPK2) n=1 Tax=Durusdinium trenchii TaxID=1381693 RepID=A0ABP0P4N2_9DINO